MSRNRSTRRWLLRALALTAITSGLAAASSAVVTAQDRGGDLCTPPQRQHVLRYLQPSPALVEAGRQAYTTSCASCHGGAGNGDGAQAARLDSRPAPFSGLKNTATPALYTALTSGHTSVEVAPLPSDARWAIAHFIRADLLPAEKLAASTPDDFSAACANIVPPESVICKPEVKKDLQSKLAFDQALLDKGKAAYNANCSSCHGEKGLGDGAASVALNPKPRNFAQDQFKAGSSAFAIFNTLAKGLQGTSMPAFDNLPEEDRWAITHYVRESLMPKERREDATPEQIQGICVELSRPPKSPEIPIEIAMQALVEDQADAMKRRHADYGPVRLNNEGDERLGQAVYNVMCQSCHGDKAGGAEVGRYGRFPFVTVSTRALDNQAAGGTWREFAQRLVSVHYTVPEMIYAGALSDQDLKSLQAFMGKGLTRTAPIESDEPRTTPVALLSASQERELLFYAGAVYRLDHPAAGGEAKLSRIDSWSAFRQLYTGPTALPEADPAEGLEIQAYNKLDCLREADEFGNRTFCTSTSGAREITVRIQLRGAAAAEPTPN